MHTTRTRVSTYDKNESATAEWNDVGDPATISLSLGGTMSTSATCLELLYEALKQVFEGVSA